MLRKLSTHLTYANVMATLGVFIALGGSAYAVNTVNSTDITDGQVKSVDVGDNEVKSADVKDESLTTFDVSTFLGQDVVDGTLTGADVQDGSVASADVTDETLTGDDIAFDSINGGDITNGTITGTDIGNFRIENRHLVQDSVDGIKVQNDSLTGADINESTLDLSSVATATTFAFVTDVGALLPLDNSFKKVITKVLPQGTWAIVATVNTTSFTCTSCTEQATMFCEMRGQNGTVLGKASDSRYVLHDTSWRRSLSMNGGAGVPAGGAEVSVWCKSDRGDVLDSGQMMMTKTGTIF